MAVIITNYYIYAEGYQFPLLLYAGPIYLWIMFFMLGIYISKNPDKTYFPYGIVIAVIGLVLQILESDYWLDTYGSGIGIKTSSFIFSSGMILMLMSEYAQHIFRTSSLTRAIAWIGEVSFGVYLIHTYCIAISYCLLHSDNWIIMWGISLGLTLAIIMIMKNIMPSRILKKYFGF